MLALNYITGDDAPVNLTPHEVKVSSIDAQSLLCFEPSGHVLRVQFAEQERLPNLKVGEFPAMPVVERPRDPLPLVIPEEFKGRDIIVSAIAAAAVPDSFTGAVYVPDTGPSAAVRVEGVLRYVKRLYLHRPRQ